MSFQGFLQSKPASSQHYQASVQLLESPRDCKEIKPVNPKEINPEYSLERLMLKLKLQYIGYLMQSQRIRKNPDAGKDWN